MQLEKPFLIQIPWPPHLTAILMLKKKTMSHLRMMMSWTLKACCIWSESHSSNLSRPKRNVQSLANLLQLTNRKLWTTWMFCARRFHLISRLATIFWVISCKRTRQSLTRVAIKATVWLYGTKVVNEVTQVWFGLFSQIKLRVDCFAIRLRQIMGTKRISVLKRLNLWLLMMVHQKSKIWASSHLKVLRVIISSQSSRLLCWACLA